eukprot:8323071-Lingulodinium_polyedra.AAC.1
MSLALVTFNHACTSRSHVRKDVEPAGPHGGRCKNVGVMWHRVATKAIRATASMMNPMTTKL